MQPSLDFSNISTWENIDLDTVCKRFSSSKNSTDHFNPGSIRVAGEIFCRMQDERERAQFFLNCETLGLHCWKLYFAYKDVCHEKYETLIKSVLEKNETLIKAIKDEEINQDY